MINFMKRYLSACSGENKKKTFFSNLVLTESIYQLHKLIFIKMRPKMSDIVNLKSECPVENSFKETDYL